MLLTVGGATAANVIGRAVNLVIPLVIIGLHGATAATDRFFIVMAVGHFFYAILANAVAEISVPLIIAGRVSLTRTTVLLLGGSFTFMTLVTATAWSLLVMPLDSRHLFAVALMAGAGLANGLAAGAWNAEERYTLPGATWSVRLIPLLIYMITNHSAGDLGWLALGIGIADWLRCGILLGGRALRRLVIHRTVWKKVAADFSTILLAALISGLNPLVDRIVAGLGGAGDVSILEAGERIFGAVAGLATIGLMSVLLTRLSVKVVAGEVEAAWPSIMRKLAYWSGGWLLLGVLLGYLGLHEALSRFTRLTVAQTDEARNVYWAYLAGLPALIFSMAYVKRFQAYGFLTILLWNAFLCVAVNIVLSWLLRRWLGVTGVAMATTVVYFHSLFIFYIFSRNKR